MATLDQLKVSAKYAFPVLHHLVDTRTLPAKEVRANEAMVARMQGLRRLSTLLCPLYSEGQADQLGRGVRPPASSLHISEISFHYFIYCLFHHCFEDSFCHFLGRFILSCC